MSKNKELKQVKVEEIKGKMEKAESMIFAEYQGLTVEEDTNLRKELRESGIEYKVYKNTLSIRAAKELGFDKLEDVFVGPVSIAFGYDEPTTPARILSDFSKKYKALELKGGVVQGEIFDVDKVKQLATIPSKEVLISKLLGSFKAPLSNFAYLLSAIEEKKQSEEV